MALAAALVDDFDDNVTDPALWTATTTVGPLIERIREVNGRLEIRPAGTPLGYARYDSVQSYDLEGSLTGVEVVRTLRQTLGASTQFTAVAGAGNSVGFSASNTDLSVFRYLGGAFAQLAEVSYDPAAHRWWRLRESDGTTFWETSPDNATWTVLHSMPNPFALTAVTVRLEAGVSGTAVGAPGVAIFDNVGLAETSRTRRIEERRRSARDVRVEAAALAEARLHDEHANNNDETNYPTRPLAGNYSKSLKHDALGDPDPASYATLLRALQSRDPDDFEEIQLASNTALKLTNPQAGLTFDIGGPDPQERTLPPAPRFDSEVAAHEMGELYWMALARDVHFSNYATDPTVATAITSLNNEFPRFGGTRPVTAANVFRGVYAGEQVGPYVSQFLLKGNTDTRKPDGLGRDANEGYVSHGAQVNDQRIIPATANVDYLTTFSSWLDVQNGVDKRGLDSFDTTRRFIRTLRDGATYVHFDQVINAFYNVVHLLTTEPTGNQLALQAGVTGRPQADLEFALDQGNPYNPPGTAQDSRTQAGFATFGPIHLLEVLGEVLGRSLRAVWWQKWGVHRRLRPEEYGGRVHNQVLFNLSSGAQGRSYPLHTSITTSLQTGGLAPYFGQAGERFPSAYLLPQAYPEGAPTHPAYGAGHATGSGACITLLKAFFDENAVIENPVQASADGLSLVAYTGVDAAQMTVGSELNKLAGNIATFRNAAGVHWRSDYTDSLPFGEAIAIGLLQELSLGFNEDRAQFALTRLDGQRIRIYDGRVVLL
jgi:hypothetical protein